MERRDPQWSDSDGVSRRGSCWQLGRRTGLYFANLPDDSGEGELPPTPFVEEKPPPPPLGGELPPIPPFMEGKLPPAAETDESG